MIIKYIFSKIPDNIQHCLRLLNLINDSFNNLKTKHLEVVSYKKTAR